MQSYLPKYPLVSECVSERKNGQPETALATVHDRFKNVLQLKVTFFKRNRAKKLFPKAAHVHARQSPL